MQGTLWYVYLLRSCAHPGRFHVGLARDLADLLRRHNVGQVSYTATFLP